MACEGGKQQFEILCASCGFHVYNELWKPKLHSFTPTLLKGLKMAFFGKVYSGGGLVKRNFQILGRLIEKGGKNQNFPYFLGVCDTRL